VLVIAPHPDDETLGCGGTIARHAQAGDSVTIAIVTDGGSSRAGGLDREQIVHERRREAEMAAMRLGATELVLMGLPEDKWRLQELTDEVVALLKELRPHVIYCPSCVDFHPEHLRVARGLAGAIGVTAIALSSRIRSYEVQVPLTPILANLVTPIGSVARLKAQTLLVYSTQLSAFSRSRRLGRYNGRLYGFDGPAEVFWEMSPIAYRKAVLDCDRSANYRGLRHRPLTDGLAWLTGWRERNRVRRSAQSTR
jgi:LmbE family N-acetylglucosaminyl deacetylase